MAHKHEWYLDYVGTGTDRILTGLCRGCPATLTLKDVETLLNLHSNLEQRIEMLEELFEEMKGLFSE